MVYNILAPWESLDKWQNEYIYETDPNQNCFLLTGRQVGKTTAMSIKAVELCVKHFEAGENVMIASLTEKQGQIMLAKALSYAQQKYPHLVMGGKEKPTQHRISFYKGGNKKRNPKMNHIYCYAAGETGQGLRGFTIKKLLIDEGSRMSMEFFIAVSPMLSVVRGSMDMASTPCGKEGFFWECSNDDQFKKFYVSAEDCPRHTKEFLEGERKRLSALAYAQEYLAIFLDEFKRIFSDELIKKMCVLQRSLEKINPKGRNYIGVDVAGFGKDKITYEVFETMSDKLIEQRENIIENHNLTTETTKRIVKLDAVYNFKKIGVDDGGVGFGVYSELMDRDDTKRRTEALNNASRPTSYDGTTSKKILKEEMYMLVQYLGESGKLKLLNDDEVKDSLSSMQYGDNGRIYGSNSHVAEGIIRGVWLAEKNKGLNIFARSF